VKWHELVAEAGLPNLHLHDVRHPDDTGNTMAVSSGAGLQVLMTRMSHHSPTISVTLVAVGH